MKHSIILLCFIIFKFDFCFSDKVQDIFNIMSLEDKIAQLFVISVNNSTAINEKNQIQNQIINVANSNNKTDELLKKYMMGGVHFTGYGNIENAYNQIKKYQKISKNPLLITQDFEWGLNMRLLDAIKFPKNMTLGAIQNDELIYLLAREIGRQCKLLGIHINFAPVVDINSDPLNPIIGERSFGDNKENVANKGLKFMQGLHDAGIIACAKHFPGHGDTKIDSHLDLPVLNNSLEHINSREMHPFKHLIKHGLKAIMSAHINIPAIDPTPNLPSSLSRVIITDILKKELNFSGLIITDSLKMKGATKHLQPGQIELKAFLAGNDILLTSPNVLIAIDVIKNAILKDRNLEKELNERVFKILKVKNELGLFDKKEKTKFQKKDFFSKEAKSLKQKLYEEAITVFNNDSKILPIKENEKIILLQNNENNFLYDQLKKINKNILHYKIDQNFNDQNLIKNNKFIFALFDLNKESNFGISQQILDLYSKLIKLGKEVILVIFGNVYSLQLFRDSKKPIIVAYEDDEVAQKAAAKLILGKIQAKGKLPIKI